MECLDQGVAHGLSFPKSHPNFQGADPELEQVWNIMDSWGGRGASVNVRGEKVTGNVGVPGTGMSYRETLSNGSDGEQRDAARPGGFRMFIWVAALVVIAYQIWR